MNELYLVSTDTVASMMEHHKFKAKIVQGDLFNVSSIARAC